MHSQTDTMNNNNKLEKVNNKNYVSDFNHALQYTRWFLTFLGIWPYVAPNPTRLERLVSKIIMPSCCIAMIISPVPTVSHLTLRGADRAELLILLAPLSFYGISMVKYSILVLRADTIRLCIEHMESDWCRLENQNDRNVMKNNLRVGHRMTVICTICMQSGNIFFHVVMPLCSGNVINEFNETVKPLPFPGTDIFFDSQATVIYEIVFSAIYIIGFLHFTVATVTFNLASILVTHACGQIEILMSKLLGLVQSHLDDNGISVVEARLSLIIPWHVRIMRFSTGIDQVLHEMCLMEVAGSTLCICLLEYYCITELNNGANVAITTYLLLLISIVFNIFIYCYIGELLKNKCFQIGGAAYMIEWYRLPGKTGLTLIMIIAMANYPKKITAGRMLELSLATFGDIIKSTFAYLNLLRNMT